MEPRHDEGSGVGGALSRFLVAVGGQLGPQPGGDIVSAAASEACHGGDVVERGEVSAALLVQEALRNAEADREAVSGAELPELAADVGILALNGADDWEDTDGGHTDRGMTVLRDVELDSEGLTSTTASSAAFASEKRRTSAIGGRFSPRLPREFETSEDDLSGPEAESPATPRMATAEHRLAFQLEASRDSLTRTGTRLFGSAVSRVQSVDILSDDDVLLVTDSDADADVATDFDVNAPGISGVHSRRLWRIKQQQNSSSRAATTT
jgi:hypothetical protein